MDGLTDEGKMGRWGLIGRWKTEDMPTHLDKAFLYTFVPSEHLLDKVFHHGLVPDCCKCVGVLPRLYHRKHGMVSTQTRQTSHHELEQKEFKNSFQRNRKQDE